MSSIGLRFPLEYSDSHGFQMTQSIKQVVRQHLKMIILTTPGERVMFPEFGVGIKQFLFQHNDSDIYTRIDQRIYKQVRDYMPGVTIKNILYDTSNIDSASIGIRIIYEIPSYSVQDLLEFTI
jgi:phage baseplate assembly protein W